MESQVFGLVSLCMFLLGLGIGLVMRQISNLGKALVVLADVLGKRLDDRIAAARIEGRAELQHEQEVAAQDHLAARVARREQRMKQRQITRTEH